jgi:hypothetical protein
MLVDLAGERPSLLPLEEMEQPVETHDINLSILALGEVINALSCVVLSNSNYSSSFQSSPIKSRKKSPKRFSTPPPRQVWESSQKRNSSPFGSFDFEYSSKMVHIPYFDSKLTHLLKESLGGNCETLFINHVTSDMEDYYQSLSSLAFTAKARKIANYTRITVLNINDGKIMNLKSESILIK